MSDEPKVEQCDRSEAASAYFAWISGNKVIPEKMLAGTADGHSMVQAFARHRIAERDRIVAWLREVAKAESPFNLDAMSALGLPLDVAASAIERGDHIVEREAGIEPASTLSSPHDPHPMVPRDEQLHPRPGVRASSEVARDRKGGERE